MGGVHFGGLLIVVAAAFGAPLLLVLVPSFRLPAVILEIIAGIVLGPSDSELAAMFPSKPGGIALYAWEGWRRRRPAKIAPDLTASRCASRPNTMP